MNWIDILLLVILGLSILWGLRTGILMTVFVVIGLFIGFAFAGSFAGGIGDIIGLSLFADSIISVVSYWLIIVASVVVATKIGGIVRPMLTLATLGAASLVDRIGGLVLGLLVGLVLITAVIVALSRIAFDFTVDYPGFSVPGTSITFDSQEIPVVEDQRESLVDALSNSRVVAVFLDFRGFVPAGLFGFVPVDFNAALGILDERIGG